MSGKLKWNLRERRAGDYYVLEPFTAYPGQWAIRIYADSLPITLVDYNDNRYEFDTLDEAKAFGITLARLTG